MANKYKIVVFVPESHADVVRETIGKAGAGKIGNYNFCSFSMKGVGRFLPGKDAKPAIGEVGKLEEVQEERIEVTVSEDLVNKVIGAIKKVHPYEEVVMDVYALEDL
jgi:hypothetical protein